MHVAKTGLASVADTECIVAKAIRDGGVDAVLDHGQSCMRSKDTPDVYATAEPASAFHARVAFCLDIHNEARCCPRKGSFLTACVLPGMPGPGLTAPSCRQACCCCLKPMPAHDASLTCRTFLLASQCCTMLRSLGPQCTATVLGMLLHAALLPAQRLCRRGP